MKDQVTDVNGYMLTAILNENPLGLPTYSAEADMLDKEASAQISDKLFAWPEKRLFPINDRPNTLLSKLYIDKQASSELPAHVATNIATAIHVFDLQGDLEELSTTRELFKEASIVEPNTLGEVLFIHEDTVKDTVTINDSSDLLKLASFIIDSPQSYPFETRCKASKQILGLVRDNGIDMDVDMARGLEKRACALDVPVENVFDELKLSVYRYNKGTVSGDALVTGMNKFASSAKTMAELTDRPTLEKVAGLVDLVDRLEGNIHLEGYLPFEDRLVAITDNDSALFEKFAYDVNGTTFSEFEILDKGVEIKQMFKEAFGKEVDLLPKMRALTPEEGLLVANILK